MDLTKPANRPADYVNGNANANANVDANAKPDFAIEDDLPQRVKQLLQQTSFKLAQNELREWGKLLMTQGPAIQAGIARRVDKRTVKKTALAAVALGVGYYLFKRR